VADSVKFNILADNMLLFTRYIFKKGKDSDFQLRQYIQCENYNNGLITFLIFVAKQKKVVTL